jgi:hypothetical protein
VHLVEGQWQEQSADNDRQPMIDHPDEPPMML